MKIHIAEKKVVFRPHHLMCALGFRGDGYNQEFIDNMTAIVMGKLRAEGGDDVLIEVNFGFDDICSVCPNNLGDKCNTQKLIDRLDNRIAKVLQVESGDVLTWGENKERIKKYMTLENFNAACKGCPWKKYGICESALIDLRQ